VNDQTSYDVLMVEDDEDFARLVVLSLEARGLSVLVAVNVEQALSMLHRQQYKVISLDAFLGQDNCGPLVRALKDESNINNDVPIVICSAHADPDFIHRIESKGHRAFNKSEDLKVYYDFIAGCCGDIHELSEEDVSNTIDNAIEENIQAQLDDQFSQVLEGFLGQESMAKDPGEAA
jgi:CheY-like chemotaxis protein